MQWRRRPLLCPQGLDRSRPWIEDSWDWFWRLRLRSQRLPVQSRSPRTEAGSPPQTPRLLQPQRFPQLLHACRVAPPRSRSRPRIRRLPPLLRASAPTVLCHQQRFPPLRESCRAMPRASRVRSCKEAQSWNQAPAENVLIAQRYGRLTKGWRVGRYAVARPAGELPAERGRAYWPQPPIGRFQDVAPDYLTLAIASSGLPPAP